MSVLKIKNPETGVWESIPAIRGEAGPVQTVNGVAPDANGNVEIEVPGGGDGTAPLIGTTETVTPTQVKEAVANGQDVALVHTDAMLGTFTFTSFTAVQSFDGVGSSIVVDYNGTPMNIMLYGVISAGAWHLSFQSLALESEIPSKLPNPEILTFKPGRNAVFSDFINLHYSGDSAQTVYLPTKTSHLENDSGFLTAAPVTSVNGQTGDVVIEGGSGDAIPDYVRTEAERVAAVVQSRQNENTISAILSSDYHLPNSAHAYYAQTLESITHAGQAMSILRKQISIDFEAKLGDLIWDNGETQAQAIDSFQLIHSLVSEGNILDRYECNGNHDHLQSSDTPLTDSQVYANIGIHNKGCVKDPANRVGGYCYKDYDEFKLRVILLNTSEANNGSFSVSTAQVTWLGEALAVPVEEGWGTLILSHHPLDWGGSSTAVMNKIKAASGIIANLHGHVHTFTQGVITGTEIPRLAIPNASPYRNNEYGTNGSAENSEGIEFGTVTTYGKTVKTANDTSFCVLTLDRASGKLYLDRYGAGIDREEDVPNWGKKGYTNLIPTAQAMDSTDPYNGTGYKDGYRLSSSSPFESAQAGYVMTGYIPYVVEADKLPGTIYIKGATWSENSNCRLFFFPEGKAATCGAGLQGGKTDNGQLSKHFTLETLGDSYFRLVPVNNGNGKWASQDISAAVANTRFFRISLVGSGTDLIITVDQPIE